MEVAATLVFFDADQQDLAIPSKQDAFKAFQDLETLRNNLAHSEQIIPESRERIVIFATRVETLFGYTLPALAPPTPDLPPEPNSVRPASGSYEIRSQNHIIV